MSYRCPDGYCGAPDCSRCMGEARARAYVEREDSLMTRAMLAICRDEPADSDPAPSVPCEVTSGSEPAWVSALAAAGALAIPLMVLVIR